MTPIPYVKRCSWDHLLITWAPRSNAVLYYCAKVLYFFIFLEIVLAVPDKGQLCSFIVKGETERCRKSDFWRGFIWGERKERGLNITKLYNLFCTPLLRLHSNHDHKPQFLYWRSQLQITTSMQFRICVKMCETKYSLSYKSMNPAYLREGILSKVWNVRFYCRCASAFSMWVSYTIYGIRKYFFQQK